MLTETWFFYKRNDEDLTGRLIAFDRRSRDSTAHTLTEQCNLPSNKWSLTLYSVRKEE